MGFLSLLRSIFGERWHKDYKNWGLEKCSTRWLKVQAF